MNQSHQFQLGQKNPVITFAQHLLSVHQIVLVGVVHLLTIINVNMLEISDYLYYLSFHPLKTSYFHHAAEMINMVKTSDKGMIFPSLNENVTPSNRNQWPSFSQSYPNDTGMLYFRHFLLYKKIAL